MPRELISRSVVSVDIVNHTPVIRIFVMLPLPLAEPRHFFPGRGVVLRCPLVHGVLFGKGQGVVECSQAAYGASAK